VSLIPLRMALRIVNVVADRIRSVFLRGVSLGDILAPRAMAAAGNCCTIGANDRQSARITGLFQSLGRGMGVVYALTTRCCNGT